MFYSCGFSKFSLKIIPPKFLALKSAGAILNKTLINIKIRYLKYLKKKTANYIIKSRNYTGIQRNESKFDKK